MEIKYKIAEMFFENKLDLSVAESFTGGSISAEITSVPGVSGFFKEGIVCYSNQAKHERLGVDLQIINRYGAVSEQVAYEMLKGLKTYFGLATTGNAGPTAEKDNDVGHCFIGIKIGDNYDVYEYSFEGARKDVISQGRQTALELLCKGLLSIKDK